VVIIGAGNVGCDVAAEAARLGAVEITLLDVQAAGLVRQGARGSRKGGRQVPLAGDFTRAISAEGVQLAGGETFRPIR
jgi:NADPH-dependent glutamate synthase beta subunit-like oxidoreductase